jgi:hypothetical protein
MTQQFRERSRLSLENMLVAAPIGPREFVMRRAQNSFFRFLVLHKLEDFGFLPQIVIIGEMLFDGSRIRAIDCGEILIN